MVTFAPFLASDVHAFCQAIRVLHYTADPLSVAGGVAAALGSTWDFQAAVPDDGVGLASAVALTTGQTLLLVDGIQTYSQAFSYVASSLSAEVDSSLTRAVPFVVFQAARAFTLLSRVPGLYSNDIVLAGHSLGAATALVVADMLLRAGFQRRLRVLMVASPRPGLAALAAGLGAVEACRWNLDTDAIPFVTPRPNEAPVLYILAGEPALISRGSQLTHVFRPTVTNGQGIVTNEPTVLPTLLTSAVTLREVALTFQGERTHSIGAYIQAAAAVVGREALKPPAGPIEDFLPIALEPLVTLESLQAAGIPQALAALVPQGGKMTAQGTAVRAYVFKNNVGTGYSVFVSGSLVALAKTRSGAGAYARALNRFMRTWHDTGIENKQDGLATGITNALSRAAIGDGGYVPPAVVS